MTASQPIAVPAAEEPVFVIGFDYSDPAQLAFDQCLSLGGIAPRSHIHVMHVIPQGKVLETEAQTTERMEETFIQLKSWVSDRIGQLHAAGYRPPEVKVNVHVGAGQPWQLITHLAFTTGAHVIFIGTHGHSDLKRAAFGSVAQKVVREAPCPVMVMRPRAVEAVPKIEPPPGPGEGSHLGKRHTYHIRNRNTTARVNLPLFFPMPVRH